jgi:RNA polymerase primary sigma factor
MTPVEQPRNKLVLTSLETYLREINATPLLTAQQEKQLARGIEEGDTEARDQMVRANLRLVVNIARSYAGRGLDLQDLIAEGNLGLLHAVERFDYTLNIRFSTYASYWIKEAIKRALTNTSKTIRIPGYMVQLLSEWRRATAKLHDELGRAPTHEEIADSLGVPHKKLAIIEKAIRVYNALPQTEQAEAGWSIGNLIVDDRAKAPDKAMAETEETRQVLKMLDQLDERSATVLRLRFGLGKEEPKTLLEIGEFLGLTRERVRQIERQALQKLSTLLAGE